MRLSIYASKLQSTTIIVAKRKVEYTIFNLNHFYVIRSVDSIRCYAGSDGGCTGSNCSHFTCRWVYGCHVCVV